MFNTKREDVYNARNLKLKCRSWGSWGSCGSEWSRIKQVLSGK